ncbi:MAG: cytochrome c-type biogenesis protein CcmH [Gammaproteobacteria bacterium]|nr:cytochrome c-type biogenesis protein CcmH [Gammaproteobacteria bacterium]
MTSINSAFLVLVLVAAPSFAAEVSEDPLERQMLEIAKLLRCAVCQNQPISDSNAGLARDMRAIIREQLHAGKARDEIIAYFVERYGNYILLKPPVDRSGAAVWFLPPLLLLVMGAFAIMFVRRRLRQPLPPAPELSDENIARVRAAREQD